MAIASLVLGIISLVAWLIPLIGVPVSIVGFVLGCKTIKSEKKAMAITGLVLCIIGLILSVGFWAYSAYLISTGQIPGLSL